MPHPNAPDPAALLDVLFDDRSAGRCLVAPDGTVLRVNDEWLRGTGLAREQAVGAALEAVYAGGRDVRIDPVPMAGGRGVLLTAGATRGPAPGADAPRGAPPAADAEARLAAIVEGADVAIVSKDLSGTVLTWNPAAEALLGYRADEMVGRSIGAIIPPECLAEEREILARISRGERVPPFETQRLRRDGARLDVSVTVSPIRGAGGRIVGASKLLRDVGARKREVESAAREHELLTRLFERVPVLIALYDPHLESFRFNDAFREVLGWTEEDAARGDLMALAYPDPEVRAEATRHMTSLSPGWREFPVAARDGRVVPTAWANLRLADDTQVGIGLDLRERKRYEAALREANGRLLEADRRKDEFLGMLSHELRNPLAPIRNALFILERTDPLGEQARWAREVAQRQVAHLTRLVDDLLDVTRVGRGKVELARTDLDLAALVRRSAEDYRSLLAGRAVALEVAVPRAPVVVHGDATRLAQVLGNLVQNAAKFTPAGGRVDVELAAEAGAAVLRVRDTGAGIEPALLDAIFEPFTQGPQTLARSEGGLGLGLALVKGLVALHGGEVRARSAGPGRGAELEIRLPLAAGEVARATAPADGSSPGAPPG